MGERTSYAPGTFSWIDLATTDADGAKRFYGELFGWQHDDRPAGDAGTYTIFRLDGRDVAACFEQSEEMRSQGIPPHWNSYVTVDDVDASARRVAELGGTVMMEPFNVMDVGRMAAASEPTGAAFMMWQPRGHIGASLVNEPGALCWNELATSDVGKAKRFFTSLFGWSTEDHDGAYTTISVGEKTNGGIRPQGEQESGVPPNWLVYIAVSDCDASARKVADLGGTLIVPPMDVPIADGGRIAVVADPQGAAFGLYSGYLDP